MLMPSHSSIMTRKLPEFSSAARQDQPASQFIFCLEHGWYLTDGSGGGSGGADHPRDGWVLAMAALNDDNQVGERDPRFVRGVGTHSVAPSMNV